MVIDYYYVDTSVPRSVKVPLERGPPSLAGARWLAPRRRASALSLSPFALDRAFRRSLIKSVTCALWVGVRNPKKSYPPCQKLPIRNP